jgi:hypothetical protein
MKAVDKVTDYDGIFELPPVHHATEATIVSKILSNDHTQAYQSEQVKETKSTSSNINNHIPSLERQGQQDRYYSSDVFTHRDFSNIPSAERQALQDLYESTDGAHWNYGSSSAGTHWNFDDSDVNPWLGAT